MQANKLQLAFVIFLVIKRSFAAPTVETLRSDLETAEDRDASVKNLSHLLIKQGPRAFMDSLIDSAGPIVLSEIEDLADMMEKIRKYEFLLIMNRISS